MSGYVVERGKRVMFNNSSESRITLRHVGDTLYGVAIVPAGRVSVAVELRKCTRCQRRRDEKPSWRPEQVVTLGNGAPVRLRPIRPDDEPRLNGVV